MNHRTNTFKAARRLFILQILAGVSNYQLNTDMIINALRDYGIESTKKDLQNEASFLLKEKAITSTTLGNYTILTITRLGLDIARGYEFVEGIERPMPSL